MQHVVRLVVGVGEVRRFSSLNIFYYFFLLSLISNAEELDILRRKRAVRAAFSTFLVAHFERAREDLRARTGALNRSGV